MKRSTVVEPELERFAAARSGVDLVPGDVQTLLAAQDELGRFGAALASVATGLDQSLDSAHWTGAAAEAFAAHRQALTDVVERWTAAEAKVQAALEQYRNALNTGQAQAEEALALWRNAQATELESSRAGTRDADEASNAELVRIAVRVRIDAAKRRATVILRDARVGVARAGDDAERQVLQAIEELRIAELPQLRANQSASDIEETSRPLTGWTGRTAIVQPPRNGIHDSLSRIAERTLGDAGRWPEIYHLNVNQLVAAHAVLRNPNLIQPGWTLRIPGDPTVHHLSPTTGTPITLPHGGSHTGPPDLPHVVAGHQTPGPPAAPPTPRSSVRGVRFTSGGGMSLGDGMLLGGGVAAVLAGVVIATGIHRSTSGRPVTFDDTDGPIIRQLAMPIAEHQLGDGDPGQDGEIAFGTADGRTVLIDVARTFGLGLTGPGAAMAARAVLISVLTTDPAAEAILTQDAGYQLLPGQLLGGSANVTITNGHGSALDGLETAILTRSRERGEDQAAPPLLFIITAPDDMHRMQAVVDLAVGLNIVVLMLGGWPAGVTCEIRADGVVVSVVGERAADWASLSGLIAFGLDGETTGALLDLLQPVVDQSQVAATVEGPVGDIAHRLAPGEPEDGAAQARAGLVIELNVLGRLRILHHGRAGPTDITAALTKRQREVLLFLAVHRGAQREALAAELWPDAPRERPYNALHTTLSQMRRALRRATDGQIGDLTNHRHGRYSLDETVVVVDLWQVQQDLEDHPRAADDPTRDATLERLLRAYSGDLAEETTGTWIEAPREAIRREVLNALADDAARLRQQDPERAVDLLEHARRLDPHNEAIYRDIMRLQARLGRYQAISRTLGLLRTALTEVDAAPSDGTVALADALERRESIVDSD